MEPIAPLEVDADSIEPQLNAVCARHPDRRASIVCPYCGSFACSDCTHDTLWGEAMCEACNEHGRAQYPLPGKKHVAGRVRAQRVPDVRRHAVVVFGVSARSRAARVRVCIADGVLSMLLSALARWLFVPSYWAAETPGLLPTVLVSAQEILAILLASLLVGAVFHAVALLFGGRAPFASALRAAFYLSALMLLDTIGSMVERMLTVGTVQLVLDMVGLFFWGWSLSLLGEHRYALPRGHAIGVGDHRGAGAGRARRRCGARHRAAARALSVYSPRIESGRSGSRRRVRRRSRRRSARGRVAGARRAAGDSRRGWCGTARWSAARWRR